MSLDVLPPPFPHSCFSFLPPPPPWIGFIYQAAINMCQMGCSQILMNRLMTASISPPVCKILDVCQSCVCLWFNSEHSCIPGSVSPPYMKPPLRMCIHCRQFVLIHTLTRTHWGKKTKPISLFQTYQWISWGSLGQSKTTILRCRQDPVESCYLSSRSFTWWWGLPGLVFLTSSGGSGQGQMSHSDRWICFSFPLCFSHISFISLPSSLIPSCFSLFCLYLIHPAAM